jgi:Zn-dependent M28 family amino/carboxypeptidase
MRLIAYLLILFSAVATKAQDSLQPVHNGTEIQSIIAFLASDSLKGRASNTPGNRIATLFIADQFKKTGLLPYPGNSYLDTFYRDPQDSSSSISNVIGILPGHSRASEIILICAHFDHLGVNPKFKKDSIFNGANDNASGVAVLLAMARYYAEQGNNERTLLFCAFNSEEKGLIGSTAFSEKMDADKIIAGINLEMLGVPKYGKNHLMMTGIERSDMYNIVRRNLKGSGIKFTSERGGDLFARSDNYSFAVSGVPAHTFLTGSDLERCYHLPCDELKRIDIPNMVSLTNAIIHGISTIIKGIDTPSRIKSY